MEMRRKDRQLTALSDILEVLDRCFVVHVGMIDDGNPYVVALSFGYRMEGETLILYCHSAGAGRKITALQKNPGVFVQMEHIGDLVLPTAGACTYSQKYEGFTGAGTASFLTDSAQKSDALNCIIHHMDPNAHEVFTFPDAMLEKTAIIKIVLDDYTAKRKA